MVKMTEEDPDYEGKWPEGDAMTEWVMVPIDPSRDMLMEGSDEGRWPLEQVRKIYRAMLDAAPAAPVQAQGEPVGQIGWADEFGNLFPMGAWKPAQRTHHDSHKTAWRPVFLHPARADAEVRTEKCGYSTFADQVCNKCGQVHGYSRPPRPALDDAMYRVAIQQRNAAWAASAGLLVDVERLRAALEWVLVYSDGAKGFVADSVRTIAQRALKGE